MAQEQNHESITFHTDDGDVTYTKAEVSAYLTQYIAGDHENIPEVVLSLFKDGRIVGELKDSD